MPEDKNMTERPGYTPEPLVGINIKVPEFPGTVTLPVRSGDLGVEWELKAPEIGSTFYIEKGKRGNKFTKKEGRVLADYNWNAVLAMSGDTADLATIKENSEKVINILSNNESVQTEFNKVLKRSFEARITYMEREKFWAEMESSNSPWNGTIETIKNKFYPDIPMAFVKNFATSNFVRLRKEIAGQVDDFVDKGKLNGEDKEHVVSVYENRIANHITKTLKKQSSSKINELKEGGLANLTDNLLNEKRFTEGVPNGKPLEGYMLKTFDGVVAEKEKIAQLKAEDIGKEEPVPNKPGFGEKLAAKFALFKEKISKAFPTSADKRRVVINTMALSLLAALNLKSDALISSTDIAEALINPPTPTIQPVSADMELAKIISDKEISGTSLAENVLPRWKAEKSSNKESLDKEVVEKTAPSPTPTPESPLKPGGIDFSQDKTISITINSEEKDLKLGIKPLDYATTYLSEEEKELSLEEQYKIGQERVEKWLHRTRPKGGWTGVNLDFYNNVVAFCHSGFSGINPTECEGLRNYIEGGDLNPFSGLSTDVQRQEKMNDLIGKKVGLEQDGIESEFVISAIAHIPNELIELYEEVSTKNKSLEAVIEATGGEEKSPFVKYRSLDKNAIFIIFCGWGPRDQEVWWAYSRYALALEPVGKEDAAPYNDPAKDILTVSLNSLSGDVHTFSAGANPENSAMTDFETSRHETENFSQEALSDPFVRDVKEIVEIINKYPEEQPEEAWTVGIGSYIRQSEYYKSLSPDQQKSLEKVLPTLDNVTYRYPGRAIECLWFESLLSKLLYRHAPENLGAYNIHLPGEIVDHVSEDRIIRNHNIETVAAGQQVIWSDHVAVVVATWESQEGPVVEIVDVNKNKDGKAKIFRIQGQEQWKEFMQNAFILTDNN
jgi:hypothetical protein